MLFLYDFSQTLAIMSLVGIIEVGSFILLMMYVLHLRNNVIYGHGYKLKNK